MNILASLADVLINAPVKRALALGLEHLLYDRHYVNTETAPKILEALTQRYTASMASLDRAIGLNVTFVMLALYAYVSISPGQSIRLPLVDLEISRSLWVRLVPAISYGLQIFILTSLLWFLLARVNIKELMKTHENRERFVDVTNILASGTIGHMGMLFLLRMIYRSRLHYAWFVPLVAIAALTLTSPLTVCIYFISQLFGSGELLLGLFYGVLLVAFVWLYSTLLFTACILVMTEFGIEFMRGFEGFGDVLLALTRLPGTRAPDAAEPMPVGTRSTDGGSDNPD